ncbi:hypothetical protein JZ751_006742 [Albula glossodonta]|uniref:CST complex subunit CTC1 n=1 Tax=Albula glossodonta TaxID=121402 RepID=A0A8T2P576_9TELE|nr:hypothetical protein JZ751_006742 [Albula glossodonta]
MEAFLDEWKDASVSELRWLRDVYQFVENTLCCMPGHNAQYSAGQLSLAVVRRVQRAVGTMPALLPLAYRLVSTSELILNPSPEWLGQLMLFPSWNYIPQGQKAEGYLELSASPLPLVPMGPLLDIGGKSFFCFCLREGDSIVPVVVMDTGCLGWRQCVHVGVFVCVSGLRLCRLKGWQGHKGVVSKVLNSEAGLYEIDGQVGLCLAYQPLQRGGRGLRPGAEIELHDVHFLYRPSPHAPPTLLCVCLRSSMRVVAFSRLETGVTSCPTSHSPALRLLLERNLGISQYLWLCHCFNVLKERLCPRFVRDGRVGAVAGRLLNCLVPLGQEGGRTREIYREMLGEPHCCPLTEYSVDSPSYELISVRDLHSWMERECWDSMSLPSLLPPSAPHLTRAELNPLLAWSVHMLSAWTKSKPKFCLDDLLVLSPSAALAKLHSVSGKGRNGEGEAQRGETAPCPDSVRPAGCRKESSAGGESGHAIKDRETERERPGQTADSGHRQAIEEAVTSAPLGTSSRPSLCQRTGRRGRQGEERRENDSKKARKDIKEYPLRSKAHTVEDKQESRNSRERDTFKPPLNDPGCSVTSGQLKVLAPDPCVSVIFCVESKEGLSFRNIQVSGGEPGLSLCFGVSAVKLGGVQVWRQDPKNCPPEQRETMEGGAGDERVELQFVGECVRWYPFLQLGRVYRIVAPHTKFYVAPISRCREVSSSTVPPLF